MNNSNYGIEDNIGGQRSKFDVMFTILNISLEPILKNHIIGKGNFSDAMANHYLSILLYHNLLSSSKDESGRTYYRTTDKGLQFIRYYKDMQLLFSRASQDQPTDTKSKEDTYTPPATKSGSKRILIVDDETDIGSAMQIGLEDNGFSVDVFNNPILALAAYKPRAYDLLLFDVKMPQMSGFELYRKIREIDDEAEVCFLTAFEMYSEEFKKVFPSMDVKYFIQKPISMTDLVDKIKDLTEKTAP